jgi:hypothetical protein
MAADEFTKARSPLEPVVGISWPRSGHHMLVRLLQLYFGSAFGYCDYYSGKPAVPDLASCCGKVPCRHPDRVTLTKNHDFDLAAPQVEGQKYLIQYRDFIPSVVSNFELYLRQGGEDTALSFRKFASAEFTRYLGFTDKWVHSDFARHQLLLNYGEFLRDPQTELTRVVTFIAPGLHVDHARIVDAVDRVDGEKIEQKKVERLTGVGVHKERDVRDFRHYSPALFAQLAALRLPRECVTGAFLRLLGRNPKEENVLVLQGYESLEALEAFLRGSDEYRARQARNMSS